MDLSQLDFVAVLLAAMSSFMLGGVWYSPWLFQRAWLEGCGLTELDLKATNPNTAVRFNLSNEEKKALVSFLKTLNDNKTTTDHRFTDPF